MIPWMMRHPRDNRLLKGWVAERSGDGLDGRLGRHLAEFRACAARYEALTHDFDELRAEATTEADALFPLELRLDSRRQIARRIENLGQAGRVISFRGRRSASLPRRVPTTRTGARWIAAAAVAGLLAGLGLGTYTAEDAPRDADEAVVLLPAGLRAADADLPQAPLDEEAFLLELEMAGGGLRTSALMPFDTFTPGVREVSAQLR
jgi:hypothetical protein